MKNENDDDNNDSTHSTRRMNNNKYSNNNNYHYHYINKDNGNNNTNGLCNQILQRFQFRQIKEIDPIQVSKFDFVSLQYLIRFKL